MKNTVIEIEDITFRYTARVPVLENVSLEIEDRDFIGLIGPNGGGKTTILRIILGLLTPEKGRVKVFGMTPQKGRRKIGYVPQKAVFHPSFPLTVADVVNMGRLHIRPVGRRYNAIDKEAAMHALETVGLTHLAGRRIGSLSGGELQRALIARALAGEPSMLMLDEPTANVDPNVESDIYELLKKLNETVTIVLVSHDVGFVSSCVNRVACLNRQLVTHPTGPFTPAMLEELYGSTMCFVHHHTHLEK